MGRLRSDIRCFIARKASGSRGRQRGAVLLALILVVTAALAAILLGRPQGSTLAARRAQTAATLNEAKQALLAYAINYPERHDGNGTPGLLPCPDLGGNGTAAANCSRAGGTTLGRFPWRTVRARELHGTHGEHLWYAVADGYRTPLKAPLNSDTEGDLTANGADDIVAVILAPGAPVDGQDRVTAPRDPLNFLEGDNAAGVHFRSHGGSGAIGGQMNDLVVAIRRNELMALVETRVLGDAARVLADYREAHGAYPWLSPFDDPALSPFRGEPGTRRGHLPFHWSGDLPGASPRNPFSTRVGWRWNVDPGTAVVSVSGSVPESCLYSTSCSDPVFPSVPEIPAEVQCTWSSREVAQCGPSEWTTVADVPCELVCPGRCEREYRISMPPYAGDVQVHPPTAASVRTRDVTRHGPLPPGQRVVEIRDRFIGATDPPACTTQGTVVTGSGFIDFTSATTGSFTTTGIRYDLDVDAGELPAWFVSSRWHELVLVVYAEGETLPGAEPSCTPEAEAPGYPCLTLQGVGSPENDKRAIVMMAGRALPDAAGSSGPGQTRPSAALEDYFEGLNAGSGAVFLNAPTGPTFNDRVRVVAALEGGP